MPRREKHPLTDVTKLTLNKETLRRLCEAQLKRAAGGGGFTIFEDPDGSGATCHTSIISEQPLCCCLCV
jgi:hypothetical protein